MDDSDSGRADPERKNRENDRDRGGSIPRGDSLCVNGGGDSPNGSGPCGDSPNGGRSGSGPCRDRGEDGPEAKLLCRYMKAGRCHRAVLERCLSFTGVYRSQHRLLMCISDYPDLSQTELARRNDVTAATVAVTLSKLEKGGYVCRAVDETDKRYNRIVLTEKGERVVKDSRRIFREIESAMFRDFTEQEFETMTALLDRIITNLSSIDPDRYRRADQPGGTGTERADPPGEIGTAGEIR